MALLCGVAVLIRTGVPETQGAPPSTGNLLYADGFERGGLQSWGTERSAKHSIRVVTKPVRSGRYSARIELRHADPIVAGGRRAEIKQPADASGQVERWYGWSLFLPEDYPRDPAAEIVTQWHASPDRDLGEVWRSPPLAVEIRNGKWHVVWRWDADRVMASNVADGMRTVNLGACRRGEWTDWVVHVRWSWQGRGLLEVWLDGTKKFTYEGPIGYNDARGVYLKLGLYKWTWNTPAGKADHPDQARILYVDAVRIGNSQASYQDVAPTGERTSDAP